SMARGDFPFNQLELNLQSARRHRLTDRRCLTRLWKRLSAQARPVITRANNSKLPKTTTALDQPEQINRLNASAKDKISAMWSYRARCLVLRQVPEGKNVGARNDKAHCTVTGSRWIVASS